MLYHRITEAAANPLGTMSDLVSAALTPTGIRGAPVRVNIDAPAPGELAATLPSR